MRRYTAEHRLWRRLASRREAQLAQARRVAAFAARRLGEAAEAMERTRLALAAAEREASDAAASRRSALVSGHLFRHADFARMHAQAAVYAGKIDELRSALARAQRQYDEASAALDLARGSCGALARQCEKHRFVENLRSLSPDDDSH